MEPPGPNEPKKFSTIGESALSLRAEASVKYDRVCFVAEDSVTLKSLSLGVQADAFAGNLREIRKLCVYYLLCNLRLIFRQWFAESVTLCAVQVHFCGRFCSSTPWKSDAFDFFHELSVKHKRIGVKLLVLRNTVLRSYFRCKIEKLVVTPYYFSMLIIKTLDLLGHALVRPPVQTASQSASANSKTASMTS